MAAPILIDQARVQRRYGATEVSQAIRDPGDLAVAIQEASDTAWRILRRGFSPEEIIKLCAEDEAVLGALAAIVMDTLAKGHNHLRLQDGRTPFWSDRAEAIKTLERTADGSERTVSEVADDPSAASKLLNDRTRTPRRSPLCGGLF